MLYATVDGSFLSGFSVGSKNIGALNISHLLFADNTLIVCGANLDHLHSLHALFLCFKAISNLKINLVKSELVILGNVNKVEFNLVYFLVFLPQ
jgi:hypothetical protein